VDLSGVRVLVVDDEADARELVRRVLEASNAIVITASSAAEGLELLRRERPHVLLSDIGMPEEDGYALLRKIRDLPPSEGGSIPAGALTAFARSEDRRRALMAGFQLHVPKPVEPTELLAVVANLAGGPRRSRSAQSSN
jgi:CheY-like chemotaxis protein